MSPIVLGDRPDRAPAIEERERTFPRNGSARDPPELGEGVPEVAAQRERDPVPRVEGAQVRLMFLSLGHASLVLMPCSCRAHRCLHRKRERGDEEYSSSFVFVTVAVFSSRLGWPALRV